MAMQLRRNSTGRSHSCRFGAPSDSLPACESASDSDNDDESEVCVRSATATFWASAAWTAPSAGSPLEQDACEDETADGGADMDDPSESKQTFSCWMREREEDFRLLKKSELQKHVDSISGKLPHF